MRKQRTFNIGLIVANIEDDFSNKVSKGAMSQANKHGDNLYIFPVKYLNFVVTQDPKQKYEYQQDLMTLRMQYN